MDYDDVVYLKTLIFCIIFGYFYRQINKKEQKKWIGTVLGLCIVFFLSGYHALHHLFVCAVNIIIILYADKKKCHIISFIFSFLYLFVFRMAKYLGVPHHPAQTNIIQMILTLKVVGLALEVKNGYLAQKESEEEEEQTVEEISKIKSNTVDPSAIDIFHYCFNYIGVITGPYFRYRTFQDYLTLPFYKYANYKESTLRKLKLFPLLGAAFLIASSHWPTSYATTDEFFQERSWLYRFWYIWPNFFVFRMRIYCGFILSECICIMAGLGAYPEITKPKSGHGPVENFEEMYKILNDPSRLTTEKYNFETVNCADPYYADFTSTGRAGMKYWNICTQYWLAMNVYKCFPYKKFRTAATLFVSAYWHGVYIGYYICIWSVAIYLPVEDLYVDLFLKNKSGLSLKMWEWLVWYMKMQFFGYLSIAMQLLTYEKVLRYYNSINHACLIGLFALYGIGLVIKSKSSQKLEKTDKESPEKVEVNKSN